MRELERDGAADLDPFTSIPARLGGTQSGPDPS